jgi:hypothetical protein
VRTKIGLKLTLKWWEAGERVCLDGIKLHTKVDQKNGIAIVGSGDVDVIPLINRAGQPPLPCWNNTLLAVNLILDIQEFSVKKAITIDALPTFLWQRYFPSGSY